MKRARMLSNSSRLESYRWNLECFKLLLGSVIFIDKLSNKWFLSSRSLPAYAEERLSAALKDISVPCINETLPFRLD